jgi:hypothetical protein
MSGMQHHRSHERVSVIAAGNYTARQALNPTAKEI